MESNKKVELKSFIPLVIVFVGIALVWAVVSNFLNLRSEKKVIEIENTDIILQVSDLDKSVNFYKKIFIKDSNVFLNDSTYQISVNLYTKILLKKSAQKIIADINLYVNSLNYRNLIKTNAFNESARSYKDYFLITDPDGNRLFFYEIK